jgi:hypothetical protein
MDERSATTHNKIALAPKSRNRVRAFARSGPHPLLRARTSATSLSPTLRAAAAVQIGSPAEFVSRREKETPKNENSRFFLLVDIRMHCASAPEVAFPARRHKNDNTPAKAGRHMAVT